MIDPSKVRRVLVVRLRSIGDTVLATPSLIALRRYLPDARIDILLEDWVAPLLEGFDAVDNVIPVGRSQRDRLTTAFALHHTNYDLAFNLHGGTTATFFTRASGARHRVGYANYRYSYLYTHLLVSASYFWGKPATHSAEQQLALLGSVGVPVDPPPRSKLTVTPKAAAEIERRLGIAGLSARRFALFHPAAAFDTKQWPAANFAAVAEFLKAMEMEVVAVATPKESGVINQLRQAASVPVTAFTDLSLPEITAMAARAALFVGNDSGIAHIAAAVQTPTVVVFGSSNRNHWYPWTDASFEIVYNEFACQPCPGYTCDAFGEPKCILSVQPDTVIAAVGRVLSTRK